MSAALELKGVSAALGGRAVLSDVSTVIRPGTLTAVCGPNGAGKTTLLKAALGLLKPTAGTVLLDGHDPRALKPDERSRLCAYLPQERHVAWGLAARDLAALGAINEPPEVARTRAEAALERVGLSGLADRSVFEMSGGERARVLLARLLAQQAPLMALDEPIAGLDPEAQLATLEILKAEASAGAAVIVTLHDLCLAGRFADRVLVLDEGCLVADDLPYAALDREVLACVFDLDAEWVEAPWGRLLWARRVGGP